MPLFFFASGYCLNEKYFSKPHIFVWRRIKGIWWPFVKWGLIFLLFHNVMYDLNIYNSEFSTYGNSSHKYTIAETLERAKGLLIHMDGIEPMLQGYWFLNALFFGSLIAIAFLCPLRYVSKKLNQKEYIPPLVSGIICLTIAVLLNYYNKTFTDLYIGSRAFFASSFIIVGYGFATIKTKKFVWWQGLLAFSVLIVNSFYNFVSVGDVVYETRCMIPYFLTAVLGTWCVYSLPFDSINPKIQICLKYIGNNTLCILTWHYLCFKLISLLIVLIYGFPLENIAEFIVINNYTDKGWFVLYFITGVTVPLLFSYYAKSMRLFLERLLRMGNF